MKDIKIVIVDDCPMVCQTLSEKLNSVPEFNVVSAINDPMIAVEEILRIKPDILLQDVIMPTLDGDDILENLKGSFNYNMGIIILSPIVNDMTITHYSKLGAHYFVAKPVNYDKLIRKVKQLYENLNQNNNMYVIKPQNEAESSLIDNSDKYISNRITKLLLRTGINPKLKGFYFLKESIGFICLSGNELCSVTKIVYPKIAKDCCTDAEKVERAIRTAIEKAFASEDGKKYYYETLGSYRNIKTTRHCPSNREFIFTMAEYVKNDVSNDLIG